MGGMVGILTHNKNKIVPFPFAYHARKLGTLAEVIDGGMVLCAVVPPVVGAGGPIESKLPLSLAASEPVETKVHGFEFPWDNGVVDYTLGR